MTFRILITGSRNWIDPEPIRQRLLRALEQSGGASCSDIVVVHGAARGADTIAEQVAAELGMLTEAWPADWKQHGRGAGSIRNAAMVAAGADACLAFPLPGSIGTHDCIRRAKAAGIPTYVCGTQETLD